MLRKLQNKQIFVIFPESISLNTSFNTKGIFHYREKLRKRHEIIILYTVHCLDVRHSFLHYISQFLNPKEIAFIPRYNYAHVLLLQFHALAKLRSCL